MSDECSNLIPVVSKKEPEASFEIIEEAKMVVMEEAEASSSSSDSGSEIDLLDALDSSSELKAYMR